MQWHVWRSVASQSRWCCLTVRARLSLHCRGQRQRGHVGHCGGVSGRFLFNGLGRVRRGVGEGDCLTD